MTKKIAGIVLITAVIAAAAIYAALSNPGTPEAQPATAMEQAAPPEEAQAEQAVTTETAAEASAPAAGKDNGQIDLQNALVPRSLGDMNAPVVIYEFASLTCPHCAHFSKDVLPQIKKEYIDTGKVRLVFQDFPLNGPAMDASMLARCLPEKQYFKFIEFLFESQDTWAYGGNYRDKLAQNAKLVGASDELIQNCLASEELKQGIMTAMQEAQKEHDVKATPTFIINGKDAVRGAQPFEEFKKEIDKHLEESQ